MNNLFFVGVDYYISTGIHLTGLPLFLCNQQVFSFVVICLDTILRIQSAYTTDCFLVFYKDTDKATQSTLDPTLLEEITQGHRTVFLSPCEWKIFSSVTVLLMANNKSRIPSNAHALTLLAPMLNLDERVFPNQGLPSLTSYYLAIPQIWHTHVFILPSPGQLLYTV